MGLIGADTDLLRAAIAAMRQGGDVIEQAFNQANQAMQLLQSNSWAGQHRQQAEELWDRLQPRFASTIAALHQLTTRTERYTNALEEAGRVFGDGGVAAPGIRPPNPPTIPTPPRPAPMPAIPPVPLPPLPRYPINPNWLKSIFERLKLQNRWYTEHFGNVGDLSVLYRGTSTLLRLFRQTSPFLDIASLGLTLAEKYHRGELNWQVAGSEVTKVGVKWLVGFIPGGSYFAAVNAGIQVSGSIFSAGTESLARLVAGPEYDARITKNAQNMTEALQKMDLMNPINKTIEVMWRGEFDKAIPTFWESTVDIVRGAGEFGRATADQISIIATATNEKLAPVIDQTREALATTMEKGRDTFNQVQEQARQAFEPARQFLSSIFKR